MIVVIILIISIYFIGVTKDWFKTKRHHIYFYYSTIKSSILQYYLIKNKFISSNQKNPLFRPLVNINLLFMFDLWGKTGIKLLEIYSI